MDNPLEFGAHVVGGRVIFQTFRCMTGWCNNKRERTIQLTQALDKDGNMTGYYIRPDLVCGECGYEPQMINNPLKGTP